MAEGLGKAAEKNAAFGDKILPGLDDPLQKLQRKGHDPFVNLAKSRKEKKTKEKEQKTLIGEQKQKEQIRLAEGVDELARRNLLSKTGGRRSLLSSQASGRGLLATKGKSNSLVPK